MPANDILTFADEFGVAVAPAGPAPEKELHLVVFRIEREEYAVPIGQVREVVRVGDITRVPHAPPHIRGVMNLRGRILPIMELRTRLGVDAVELTSRSRVVVVDVSKRMVGLLVDSVGQVTRVGESRVTVPPEEVRSAAGEAVTGVARVGERLLLLLDLERVLRSDVNDPSTPMAS
jgi:purine-binding chemotaxis protein CheW